MRKTIEQLLADEGFSVAGKTTKEVLTAIALRWNEFGWFKKRKISRAFAKNIKKEGVKFDQAQNN